MPSMDFMDLPREFTKVQALISGLEEKSNHDFMTLLQNIVNHYLPEKEPEATDGEGIEEAKLVIDQHVIRDLKKDPIYYHVITLLIDDDVAGVAVVIIDPQGEIWRVYQTPQKPPRTPEQTVIYRLHLFLSINQFSGLKMVATKVDAKTIDVGFVAVIRHQKPLSVITSLICREPQSQLIAFEWRNMY